MRRFELVDEKSSKFWEVDLKGVSFTVRYGRIGTDGQSKDKAFDDGDAAQAAAEKLIKAKVKKGYAEVSGAVGGEPASSKPNKKVAKAAPKAKKQKAAVAPAETSPETSAAIQKTAPKKAPTSARKVAGSAITDASLTRLRGLAFPTRARPEGSVAHMSYIEVHSYDGAKFEETFMAFVNGSIDSHPGLFLREFVKLDEAEANKVRPAVTKRFHQELAKWEEKGSAAGLCAFVLQDDKDIVDALYARVMEADRVAQYASAALNGLRDAERVAAYVEKCLAGSYWAQFQLNYLDPVTLVLQCGTALVPTLIGLASREFEGRGVDDHSDVAHHRVLLALALVPTAEGARYLLSRGEERMVFPLLAQACEIEPEVMLLASLDLLTRSPNHALAGDLVARLLRANPALAKLAQSDNQEVLVASFSRGESAPTSKLPASLQAEPWKGLKPLKRPQVSGLAADVKEEVKWPKGLRMEWLESDDREGRYWLRYVLGKDFYAKHKEALDSVEKGAVLVEEMVTHIGDGSDLDPAACFQNHIASLSGWRVDDFKTWGVFWLSQTDARISLPMWNAVHPCWWKITTENARRVVAAYELDALDLLLARAGLAEIPSDVVGEGKTGSVGPMLEAALPLASSRLVEAVALGLSGRQGRKPARRWLLAHTKLAAAGLIPLALGEGRSKKDKAPDGAVTGLQILSGEGHRGLVEEAAKAYGADALKAVTQILNASPYALKKTPKLPKWLDVSRLAPIEARAGDALDDAATTIVLGMLAASTEEGAYPALEEVQEFCTTESLDAFAWSLFREWAWAGAPSKDKWALLALGWIGDESVCRNLAELMLRWPSDGLAARAKVGVEILARIGSERALMALYQFSEKAKTKGLKTAAKEKVEEIAEALGMSTDELADRLVPDLGLGADGRLQFDLAEAGSDELMLQVGLDAHLLPYAMDGEGQRLAKFPKATGAFKGADKVKLKAASKAFKTLAKDAKAVAKHALARLESAMVKQRSWSLDVASRCFFEHPVMRSPAGGLIWVSEGKAFRVAEDGTFADMSDDEIALPLDAEVHVYHPATVSESVRGSAGDLLADYELLQPFEQVGRPVYATADFDLGQWKGRTVKSSKLFALAAYGWKREVDDATKAFNVKGTAKLSYSPGLTGGPDASPTQTLGALEVDVDPKTLSAIDASELIHDMVRICRE